MPAGTEWTGRLRYKPRGGRLACYVHKVLDCNGDRLKEDENLEFLLASRGTLCVLTLSLLVCCFVCVREETCFGGSIAMLYGDNEN